MTIDPRALFLRGDLEGALAAYDREIEANPADASAHAGRAEILFYRGDLAGSMQGAQKAIEIDSSSSRAHLLRARLLEPANRFQAIAEATRAIETDPRNTTPYYWRALWRADSGDPGGALKDLKTITSVAAQDPFRHFILGQAHLALREPAEALKALDTSIDQGVTLPFAYYARAEARSRLKMHEGAIEDYGRALNGGPSDGAVLLDRGRERAIRNDFESALADFNRAIELNPNAIAAFFYRAWVHSSLNSAAAKDDFSRAAGMPARTVDDYYFRGLARDTLGRRTEAIDDFSQAMKGASILHPRRREIEERAQAVLPKTQLGSTSNLRTLPWATLSVLAANVAVWLLQGDLTKTPDGPTLVDRGALWGPSVWKGEYWRLFSAMFLHIGAIHLFWNIYGGYWACAAIEKMVGPWRFLVGYLLSGLGGSAASLLFHMVASAGSSGALFGMLGMVLAGYYVQSGSLYFFFNHPRVRSLLKNIGIWFLLGIVALPMDNYAHFGGLVFGVLIGILFLKGPKWGPARRTAAWAGVIAILASTTVLACTPHGRPEIRAWVAATRAEKALEKGNIDEALIHFDEAVREEPRNHLWRYNRGYVFFQQGRKHEALEDFKKAVELSPSDWKPLDEVRNMIRSMEKGEPLH